MCLTGKGRLPSWTLHGSPPQEVSDKGSQGHNGGSFPLSTPPPLPLQLRGDGPCSWTTVRGEGETFLLVFGPRSPLGVGSEAESPSPRTRQEAATGNVVQ